MSIEYTTKQLFNAIDRQRIRVEAAHQVVRMISVKDQDVWTQTALERAQFNEVYETMILDAMKGML